MMKNFLHIFRKKSVAKQHPSEQDNNRTTETGRRATPENSIRHLYNRMWADPTLRQSILDIRAMDRQDSRVKRIHTRTARDTVKGGIMLNLTKEDAKIRKKWDTFYQRLGLDNPQKLKSDARGLMMEGNLPMQWVLNDHQVVASIRMPSETIKPMVDINGQFISPLQAYRQIDPFTGHDLANFALYQLTLGRLDPDNWDDFGAMGRPYLDASRTVWQQLQMTEEDLVVRRRVRAPLRMAHVLEGAKPDELEAYRVRVENDASEVTTDYYLNRKGSVNALQGDANLDQIADVSHLLDTFFSGAPAPKGLFGYTADLSRDILEDLKRDYYEEVDAIQDTLAWIYQQGFILDLLLSGINPNAHDFSVAFAERRTETANQAADLALKWQAMGIPHSMIWKRVGLNVTEVLEQREIERQREDPYPDDMKAGNTAPHVSITPSNAPKGESATSISNP